MIADAVSMVENDSTWLRQINNDRTASSEAVLFLWGPTGKGGVFLSLPSPGFEILYINGIGPSLTGKFRKVEAHNMVPHFTVSFAANLPGVLHSLEPRIIGDD